MRDLRLYDRAPVRVALAGGPVFPLIVVAGALAVAASAGVGVVLFAVSRVSGDTVPSDGQPRSG